MAITLILITPRRATPHALITIIQMNVNNVKEKHENKNKLEAI